MIEKYIKNDINLKRWRRFKANKLAVASSFLIVLCLIGTICAPLISNSRPIVFSYNESLYFPVFKDYHPKDFNITDSFEVNYRKLLDGKDNFQIWPPFEWDPFETNKTLSSYPAKPTSSNIMGTDDRGRDVFARILYGFKYSIGYAVLVWALSFMMGILVGGVSGFFGGRTDFLLQRVVEILSTVPTFFLLLIMISIFEPNLYWLVLISSIFGWIPISYFVRGEFLKNRKMEYVEAANAVGASRMSLILKHILPNSLGPVITFSPFVISGNIAALAGLDFLGFGLQVPTPSWGELLNQAQANFTIAWWLAVFPSFALFFTLVLLNLIGDGVRDAMDPRKVS